MAFIEWKDEFSVKVLDIDNQHKKLLGMINDLHSAATQGKGKTVIEDIISRMVDYTIEHFTKEEAYMSKYGFPDLENHKKEHKFFVEKVKDFQSDFTKGKLFVTIDVLTFLSSWLKKHILLTDQKYSDFFNKKGLK